MTRGGAASDAVELEGAGGESCAPFVRAAVVLSCITQQPFEMHWSEEAGLTADAAAALKVGLLFGGRCQGLNDGAKEVRFDPAPLKSGTIRGEVAGDGLLRSLEMMSLVLSFARGPSEVRLSGVTHPIGGLSFHESALGWGPLLERLGVSSEFRLEAAGFSAEAPGAVSARVFPSPRFHPIELTQRGMLLEVQAIVLMGNLGVGIAVPIERRLHERLRARGIVAQVEMLPLPVEKGRGVSVALFAQFEHTRVAFSVTGAPGQAADSIAEAVVDRLHSFLRHRGAVPGELSARLIVPLALAASSRGAPGSIGRESRGTSRLTTTEVTPNLLGIAGLARRFLDVDVQVQGLPGDEGLVEIRPRPVNEA
jgi:RNA 3'-terminal phosphate cyclase (ATP)